MPDKIASLRTTYKESQTPEAFEDCSEVLFSLLDFKADILVSVAEL